MATTRQAKSEWTLFPEENSLLLVITLRRKFVMKIKLNFER